MNSIRSARLKKKKKKPDADVGSAKYASQMHPKSSFEYNLFLLKLKIENTIAK